jgi:hypothetical protein
MKCGECEIQGKDYPQCKDPDTCPVLNPMVKIGTMPAIRVTFDRRFKLEKGNTIMYKEKLSGSRWQWGFIDDAEFGYQFISKF